MANILFKRGLHANLPAVATDGAFYLTEDSHRLYVGIGTELVDLNKYIKYVNSIADLRALETKELGDFAYIGNDNILAIYKVIDSATGAKDWVQINQNTNNINKSLTATGKDSVLTLTLEDTEGKKVSETITFVGTKGDSVSVGADGTVTVTGNPYTLTNTYITDDSLTGNQVAGMEFNLNSESDDVEDTKVTLTAGANVTFEKSADNKGLVISTHDATKLTSDKVTVSGADITVEVTDSTGKTVTNTASDVLYYKYGKDGTAQTDNQGTLNVYTISEVDDLLKGLNAMSYKGTVNTKAALFGKTNVAEGDTWMAGANFEIDIDPSASAVLSAATATSETRETKIGDLFIATGTEVNGVIASPTWIYVPAGDDSQWDTIYKADVATVDNSMTIRSNTDENLVTIDVDNTDKSLTLTSSATTDAKKGMVWTLDINHAAADINKTSLGSDDDVVQIEYYGDVDGDTAGHLTTARKKVANLMTYTLQDATVSVTSNKATVGHSMKNSAGTTRGTSSFTVAANSDDNLVVAQDGTKGLNISMVWGTFGTQPPQ